MRISDWSSDVCSSDLRLADHRGRGDHFGSEQEGERACAADELRPDEAHHRLSGNAERERDARLRRDDPETDLADLLRDRGEALFGEVRSEEHTSELQSLMRISYAVFCLKKKNIPL